ncbi:MAG: YabP/YqfC family sporulation protein [Lachnospiraceae bacterium]
MGRGRALIEQHRGLAGYTHERIEVLGGRTRLIINGEALELAAMDRERPAGHGRTLGGVLNEGAALYPARQRVGGWCRERPRRAVFERADAGGPALLGRGAPRTGRHASRLRHPSA